MKRFPRLNLKNINRLFMLAVVFAPIFYLFGSLFTALNGANGVQLFSQEEEETSVDMSVTYDGNSYTRVMYDNSAYVKEFNASALPEDSNVYFGVNENGVLCMDICPFYDMFGYLISPTAYYISFNPIVDHWLLDEIILNDNSCASLSFVSDEDLFYLEVFQNEGSSSWFLYDGHSNLYTDIGSLPAPSLGNVSFFSQSYSLAQSYSSSAGYNYSIDFTTHPRHIPEVQPNIVTPSVSEEISYSDYVFGQFFAKDNFLVQMGKDSLSADPNGFAPANSLVQLLDGSIFHYGSENQIACMAYGYAVWVFNAVVLDMVIVLALKLLLLPLRAVEIFEKGEKE